MAVMGRDDYAKTYGLIKTRKQKNQGVIYIEDISDKLFWQKIAINHEIKLYSENGANITGKSKLLKICSPNQLIAIDSDFDDICPNHRDDSILLSNKSDFILKTYAHGRENIVFSPECLSEILDNKFSLYMDNHDNPISDIFNQLSEIWYEPYQKFLYLFDSRKCEYNKWIDEIKFKNDECKDISSNQNFDTYQTRISKFDNKLFYLIDDYDDFNKFCDELKQKNFNKNTVWAFIHCHDFEKCFVAPILNCITKDRQDKEMGDIDNNYTHNEIGDRKREIANHFKQINKIETVLHHYFYDVYFNVAKNSHMFLSKIIQDYDKILKLKTM